MTKAEISVIIPLFNKEKIVEKTVGSVLTQMFYDFELIIVDDGSTDGSVSVVRQIDDQRVRLISQENMGPSAARNTGVRNANTDWVVFLDADDELLPNALKHFSEVKDRYGTIDIFDCSSIIRNKGKRHLRANPIEGVIDNPLKECFYGKIGPGSGHAMFRKSLLEQFPYDERLRRFEDAEHIIRILPHAKVYSSKEPTFVVNADYSFASAKRDNIAEDYVGHLSLNNKSFWAKMCVFRTYLENRDLYPEEMRQLYPTWRYRYDLLLLYKLLNLLGR